MIRKKFRKFISRLLISAALPFYGRKIEKSIKEKWTAFGVESSNICNANCRFCGYDKKIDKREKGFASFEVLKYSLDLYHKAGGGNFSFCSVLGDPLCDKELLKKIKFIKSYPTIKGIRIYSNLIGLDNFNIDDFVNSGLTGINISTTIGDSAAFKGLYGVDLYHKVMGNIVKLLKRNAELNKPIKIRLLLRMNYNFLRRLNKIKEFNEIKRYLRQKDIVILEKTKWDDYNKAIKKSDLPKGAKFKINLKNKKVPCYGLYRKIQVLKNGDISICSCRISPELIVDNVFRYRSLYDYWRGQRLDSFRRRWMEGEIPSICRGCTHYKPYTHLLRRRLKYEIYSSITNLILPIFGKC